MARGKVLKSKIKKTKKHSCKAIASHDDVPEYSQKAKAMLCPDDEGLHVSAKDAPTALPLSRRRALPHHVTAARAFKAPAKPVARDPRFDDLSGTLDITKFRTKYKFIEEMRSHELRYYTKQLKQCQDADQRNALKLQIAKLKNVAKEKQLHDQARAAKKAEHEASLAALREGRLPYYKRRSEARVEELVGKFDQMKQEGKLKKFLSKKDRKETVKMLKKK